MATATTFDMQLIAQDATFANRVKIELLIYSVFSASNKNFAAQVFTNLELFTTRFVWAAAGNQTLANDVITNGNANANFTTSTTPTQVAAAIQAGLTDTDLSNAVSTAFVAFANV